MVAARPWSAVAGGVALAVRLTPKGGRDAIDGIEHAGRRPQRAQGAGQGGAERGRGQRRADAACIAKAVGVPPRDVTLTAGATARIKRLIVAGDPPTLIAALEKIAATG